MPSAPGIRSSGRGASLARGGPCVCPELEGVCGRIPGPSQPPRRAESTLPKTESFFKERAEGQIESERGREKRGEERTGEEERRREKEKGTK